MSQEHSSVHSWQSSDSLESYNSDSFGSHHSPEYDDDAFGSHHSPEYDDDSFGSHHSPEYDAFGSHHSPEYDDDAFGSHHSDCMEIMSDNDSLPSDHAISVESTSKMKGGGKLSFLKYLKDVKSIGKLVLNKNAKPDDLKQAGKSSLGKIKDVYKSGKAQVERAEKVITKVSDKVEEGREIIESKIGKGIKKVTPQPVQDSVSEAHDSTVNKLDNAAKAVGDVERIASGAINKYASSIKNSELSKGLSKGLSGISKYGGIVYKIIVNSKEIIIAIQVIVIFCLIVAMIYILLSVAQPRIFMLCHDEEPFDQNMVALFERAADLSKKHFNVAFTKDDWTFYYMFAEYIDYINKKNNLGNPDIYYSDLWGNAQSISPISHTKCWGPFVMNDKNYFPKQAPKSVYEKVSKDLDGYVRGTVNGMNDFRSRLADTVKSLSDSSPKTIEILELNLILNVYTDQFIYFYNMRRPWAFMLKTTILKVHLSQFSHYCFEDQIRDIVWRKWFKTLVPVVSKGIHTFAELINNALKSFVDNLISDNGANNITEGLGGIISLFMIIPNTFKILGQLFNQLSKLASNPIGFVEWILLVILAISLQISWTIFYAFLMIVVEPLATALVFSFCSTITTLWTVIFFIVFLLLLILELLDQLFWGIISKFMRCENKPDAWKIQAGFHNGNIYSQNIICSYPCMPGYKPGGYFWCLPVTPGQPTYCPQQYIQSTCAQSQILNGPYKEPGNRFEPRLPSLPNKMKPLGIDEYVFPAWPSFYAKSSEEQKSMLVDFFPNIKTYFHDCHSSFMPYNPITLSMCNDLSTYVSDKDVLSDLNKLCYQTYCDFYTSAPKGVNIKPNFCLKEEPPNIPPARLSHSSIHGTTKIQTKIAVAALATIIVIAILIALYFRYTRKSFPNTDLP